jgi:hypothetical protein
MSNIQNGVLSPEEARKRFMEKGNVEEVPEGNFNPLLRLQNDKGLKLYLHGILLKKRERKEIDRETAKEKILTTFTFKVVATNAKASTRVSKDSYKDIDVEPGIDVDYYNAPVGLVRGLSNVPFGAEVFISYEGREEKAQKGRAKAHKFKIVFGKAEIVDEPEHE